MAQVVPQRQDGSAPRGQAIGSIVHPMGRSTARCDRCQDSGSVWIVCPDAGAVKVPCDCSLRRQHAHHLGLVDISAAAVFAGGCAALLMLL